MIWRDVVMRSCTSRTLSQSRSRVSWPARSASVVSAMNRIGAAIMKALSVVNALDEGPATRVAQKGAVSIRRTDGDMS